MRRNAAQAKRQKNTLLSFWKPTSTTGGGKESPDVMDSSVGASSNVEVVATGVSGGRGVKVAGCWNEGRRIALGVLQDHEEYNGVS